MKGYSTQAVPDNALLIGVLNRLTSFEQAEEYLSELSALAYTAGMNTAKKMTVKVDAPNPATFVGSGKVQELVETCKQLGVTLVVFDDELTPTQLRNLEKAFELRVMDRTALILQIFKAHAKTATAKAQVELAQLQYMLPRLT